MDKKGVKQVGRGGAFIYYKSKLKKERGGFIMKRFALLVLCLLVLGGTIIPVFASEEGKLLIWADDTRSGIMRELAKEFTTKYQVPVEVQELNFGDIRD
ncbi:MAG TPA: hypothetical protein DD734_03085, partial [Firmicutes bacterium]|nr:hypothetical protein [Bacillota bacterium]